MLSKLVQSPVSECGISSIYPTLQSPSVENPVLLPLLTHLTLNMAGPISGMQITGAVPGSFKMLSMALTTTVPAPSILFLELLIILDIISATMHVSFSCEGVGNSYAEFRSKVSATLFNRLERNVWLDMVRPCVDAEFTVLRLDVAVDNEVKMMCSIASQAQVARQQIMEVHQQCLENS